MNRLFKNSRSFIAAAVLLLPVVVFGEVRELAGVPGRVVVAERTVAREMPVRAFARLSEEGVHRLGHLSATELDTLQGPRFRDSIGERTKVGIVRDLPYVIGFRGTRSNARMDAAGMLGGGLVERMADGRTMWTAGFSSAGAGAMRLHLEDISVPVGTTAFVYAASGESHGPYALGGDGLSEFWTNTVFSDEIYLEIQVPAGVADLDSIWLTVSSIGHLQHGSFAPSILESMAEAAEALPGCFRDASCMEQDESSGIESASKAVALISYLDGPAIYTCSGGLLNTTAGTEIPYFLTANHCVSTAASAASLEAFWDYKTDSCGVSEASRSGAARTLGSILLATGSKDKGKADFTLLRLSEQPPAGRFYFGWTAEKKAAMGGAILERIAHPGGGPQSYSTHQISSTPTPGSCDRLSQPTFIYSKNIDGATKGGSSGSPLFLRDGLRVVGQLYGRCGRNLEDACDAIGNSAVDGAFSAYFDEIKQWLAPEETPRCHATALNLCLANGRFLVGVLARDFRTGRGTTGVAIPENDVFGYFSLPELTGQSENPEVFVKIVDGSAVNGKFWVFYGGLTDLEFQLTVTDMSTGITKSYTKDGGGYCGDSDTGAF